MASELIPPEFFPRMTLASSTLPIFLPVTITFAPSFINALAAVVLGIAAVGAGVGYVGSMNGNAAPNLDAGNAGTGDSSGGAWEDRMAAMSAKYGGGLNFYHPIQY